VAIGLILGGLLAEGCVRGYFALDTGPRVLLYGTSWYRNVEPGERAERQRRSEMKTEAVAAEWGRKDSVELHGWNFGGYTKFFPGELKTTKDFDTGQRISVTINSRGFRGGEFASDKAAGVVRILALGASSTFGYYNRDEETYPFLLERLLNGVCRGSRRFEVINFAIPHANSANIAAMFLAEGMALAPDVVTFYEGRNDSTLDRKREGRLERLYSVLVNRVLLVAFIDQIVLGERVSLTDPSLKLGPLSEQLSRGLLRNLTAILEASRKAGALLIVASQQATSRSALPGAQLERVALRGTTFDQEADEIARRLERRESVTFLEFSLLVHRRLMQDMKQWAERNAVPFVDIIGTLDQHRHYLLSWVHLHPEANRMVAAKLSEPILQRYCPGASAERR